MVFSPDLVVVGETGNVCEGNGKAYASMHIGIVERFMQMRLDFMHQNLGDRQRQLVLSAEVERHLQRLFLGMQYQRLDSPSAYLPPWRCLPISMSIYNSPANVAEFWHRTAGWSNPALDIACF